MPTYTLRTRPEDIIRLVRAETKAAGGNPEVYVDAWRDYVIEEEFDRRAHGALGGPRFDLVMKQAFLKIEPRLEQNYWVLSVETRDQWRPEAVEDESALLGAPMTLDEFEAALRAGERSHTVVRLSARTLEAKRHFDRWWEDLNVRHPKQDDSAAPAHDGSPRAASADPTPAASADPTPAAAADPTPAAAAKPKPAAEATPVASPMLRYRSREAVGVLPDAAALEAAVNRLETSGFDRAAISVLGTHETARDRIGHLYRSVAEIEDDPAAPHGTFVSRAERLEGRAAAIMVPLYVGGMAGAAAVAATGGALAVAIAVSLLGGAAGAGLGGLLAHVVAHRHARRIEEQLAEGGLVLWVSVPREADEKRALALLSEAGARDVHVHEITRTWGPDDRPLAEVNVDPVLERDPED
jgi:hypothetical protein